MMVRESYSCAETDPPHATSIAATAAQVKIRILATPAEYIVKAGHNSRGFASHGGVKWRCAAGGAESFDDNREQ
jgi:hypothetical protein